MTVPQLNWLIVDPKSIETYGTDNEILKLGFTLPDTGAANSAVLLALVNLQTETDQQVQVNNFGGQSVVATLNWLELRQDPGQQPIITLELELTENWSEVPTI